MYVQVEKPLENKSKTAVNYSIQRKNNDKRDLGLVSNIGKRLKPISVTPAYGYKIVIQKNEDEPQSKGKNNNNETRKTGLDGAVRQNFPLEKFSREAFAGLLGYGSHYVWNADFDENVVRTMSDSRTYFHQELVRLHREGLAPRWAHQLLHQNFQQNRLGGELPMDAAEFMINQLRSLGQAARNEESRQVLAKHYVNFQLRSVPFFEAGGSSYAPRLLHHMAMPIQLPMVFFGGHRWVNRPAMFPAFGGPRTYVPLALSFAALYKLKNWSREDNENT